MPPKPSRFQRTHQRPTYVGEIAGDFDEELGAADFEDVGAVEDLDQMLFAAAERTPRQRAADLDRRLAEHNARLGEAQATAQQSASTAQDKLAAANADAQKAQQAATNAWERNFWLLLIGGGIAYTIATQKRR